jgi:preprotein translocase subunit SecA
MVSTQKKVEGMNFDVRKNLIDYDSVLSNQRELIYKQRDQILKNLDNTKIIVKMCENIARMIVGEEIDNVYVDHEEVAAKLNKIIFKSNLISQDIFENKTFDDAIELIIEIIETSIDKRIQILGQEQSAKILRDIMVQCLDLQ